MGLGDTEVEGFQGKQKGFIEEVGTRYYDHRNRLLGSGKEAGWPSLRGTAGANTEKWVQEGCAWREMYSNRATPQHSLEEPLSLMETLLCSVLD